MKITFYIQVSIRDLQFLKSDSWSKMFEIMKL